MDLNAQDIIEFQKLWKLETGQDITPEQAREYALNIIGLIECVYKKHTHRARDSPS